MNAVCVCSPLDHLCSGNFFFLFFVNSRKVWGGEHIHVGLYTTLEGDDAKLEGVPRITRASSVTTDELLSRCFPEGEGAPPPSECTLMDMGSGYGGTARVAARKLGCKVSLRRSKGHGSYERGGRGRGYEAAFIGGCSHSKTENGCSMYSLNHA